MRHKNGSNSILTGGILKPLAQRIALGQWLFGGLLTYNYLDGALAAVGVCIGADIKTGCGFARDSGAAQIADFGGCDSLACGDI